MAEKEWSVGVFGIITDRKGRILVSRRADGQGWDLPGGGVCAHDGDFFTALRREIQEETRCLVCGNITLIGVYPDFGKKDVMILYFVPRIRGKPKPTDESLEQRFVDQKTLDREIRLVWQKHPGDPTGRFYEMLRDAFAFIKRAQAKSGKSRFRKNFTIVT